MEPIEAIWADGAVESVGATTAAAMHEKYVTGPNIVLVGIDASRMVSASLDVTSLPLLSVSMYAVAL